MAKTSITMSHEYLGTFSLDVATGDHRDSTLLSLDELRMLKAQCMDALAMWESWQKAGFP